MDLKQDRRLSPRIKDSMAVKIMKIHSSGEVQEDDTYSIDISSGGIYFCSNLDLRAGDRIEVRIIPPTSSISEFGMALKASAVVLRSSQEENDSTTFAAARFDAIPSWEAI
ncbi:MAG: PilZ domain-containing protein [Acidobacteriota bacterium]